MIDGSSFPTQHTSTSAARACRITIAVATELAKEAKVRFAST